MGFTEPSVILNHRPEAGGTTNMNIGYDFLVMRHPALSSKSGSHPDAKGVLALIISI